MKIKIINFLKTHGIFIFIFLTFFTFSFLSLNKELFIDWDECLYSVYPLEMRKSANFLVNQWNDYLDLQKPPLYSWFLQLPFSLGKNEFYPRLLSLFASTIILIVFYFFTANYFSPFVATTGTLFILLSDVFIFYSQKLNTDIFYSLFIFLGFIFWITKKTNLNSILAGFFFGLAVMVKGLSILPFILAIFFSLFLKKEKKDFNRFLIFITIFFITIFPWHILTWLKYKKDFIQVYLIENLIQRARYPIEFHFGGRKFYLEILFKQYSLWLILIIYYCYSFISQKGPIFKKIAKEKLSLTFLFFIFIPLIFYSQVKTKISWYLMPIYPFLSLFLGINLEKFLKNRSIFIKLFFLTILIVSAILNIKNHILLQRKEISPRNEIAFIIKKQPQKTLYYLVPHYERTAKALLDQNPQLKIRSTFIYGGNPCMVYYSQKKVYYFYSIEEFKKSFKKNRLLLIENNDLPLIKDLPKKIIYQNKEFTAFELKTYL